MRLIDADAIINKLNKKIINPETVFINTVLKGLIERTETIKAEPVKHGRWIERTDSLLETYYTCTNCNEDFYMECGSPIDNGYIFCPNCGAKMDAEEEKE